MSLIDLHIGEIRLRVGGLDEDSARALARLVAEGLATTDGVTGSSGRADRLAVSVPSQSGDAPASLAARIVDRVRSEIDRLAGGGGPAS